MARQGLAWRGKEWQGEDLLQSKFNFIYITRRGKARPGKAGQGADRRDRARQGEDFYLTR